MNEILLAEILTSHRPPRRFSLLGLLNSLDFSCISSYGEQRIMDLPTCKNTPRVVGVVSDTATWLRLSHAALPCDVVELRVDSLPPAERRLPLQAPCPKPLLLTLRHRSEGGACEWDEAERLRLAQELLPAANMLDWEIAHMGGAADLLREAKSRGVTIVASAHYFHSTPPIEEMHALAARARAAGADIVKIAFTPGSDADMAAGLEFLRTGEPPIAIMGMGAVYGPLSRKLYSAHGSALLYGYLGGVPSAPGQLSAAECRQLLGGR